VLHCIFHVPCSVSLVELCRPPTGGAGASDGVGRPAVRPVSTYARRVVSEVRVHDAYAVQAQAEEAR
jgi:hypothetical protein